MATDISHIPKLGKMTAQQYPQWASMTGDYTESPWLQGTVGNMWDQFYQNLPQVYSPVNAAVSGAGRTGSGVHARLMGDAGNRAFLGAQGQEMGLRQQDYSGFMDRKNQLMQAKMQEDAMLRQSLAQQNAARISGKYGLQAARASARPGMINAMMNAGMMMDQAMNPYAQGLGYLGQYAGMMNPLQTFGNNQGGTAGALQGGLGGAMMGYGYGGYS